MDMDQGGGAGHAPHPWSYRNQPKVLVAVHAVQCKHVWFWLKVGTDLSYWLGNLQLTFSCAESKRDQCCRLSLGVSVFWAWPAWAAARCLHRSTVLVSW
jgi:hypothetical protein